MSLSSSAALAAQNQKNVKSSSVETNKSVSDQKSLVSKSKDSEEDISVEDLELLIALRKLQSFTIPAAVSVSPSSSQTYGSKDFGADGRLLNSGDCSGPELKQLYTLLGTSVAPVSTKSPAVLGVGYPASFGAFNLVTAGTGRYQRIGSSICMRRWHIRVTYDSDANSSFNWPIRCCAFIDRTITSPVVIVGDPNAVAQQENAMFNASHVANQSQALGNVIQHSRFHILRDEMFNCHANATGTVGPLGNGVGGGHFNWLFDIPEYCRQATWYDPATNTAILTNVLYFAAWTDTLVGDANPPPTIYMTSCVTFTDS